MESKLSSEMVQYVRFPVEILLKIFEEALAMESDRPVNGTTAGILLHAKGRVARFLGISKWSVPIVLEAFYSNHHFKNIAPVLVHAGPTRTQIVLPPVHVRNQLQHLEFSACITDYYKSIRWTRPIRTLEELYTHYPGWPHLKTLTNDDWGFKNLKELKISLYVHLKYTEDIETFSLLIEKAQIRIKAGRIKVVCHGNSKSILHGPSLLRGMRFEETTRTLYGPSAEGTGMFEYRESNSPPLSTVDEPMVSGTELDQDAPGSPRICLCCGAAHEKPSSVRNCERFKALF